MPRIEMNEASIRFFVNPPLNNKDAIYTEAVKRAYSDMSRHTLYYANDKYKGQSKKATEARDAIKESIKNDLKEMEDQLFSVDSQPDFDKLHLEMCKSVERAFTSADSDRIIPINATPDKANDSQRKETFSMGQAQKVVNMVWKYVYLFYQYFNAKTNSDYAEKIKSFEKIVKFLHAPVDSYVISAATKDLGCEAPKYPWSQLYYDEYLDFQKSLRNNLNNYGKPCPFIWELENYPFRAN